MKYGFVIPGGDVRELAEVAREAEEAGWDGVFIPDSIYIDAPGASESLGFDPWIALTAIAMRTERIKMGTMITPVSRRRPWKLARETSTLDRLSNGRLILPVGLGALDDAGFGRVGEATDRKTRAELLDEGLEIITGLWSGQPFSYNGKHYQLENLTFLPPPVQKPRIPVWVVGAWPRTRSMQRALRYDGILPNKLNADGSHGTMTPDDIRDIKTYVEANRTDTTPFDIVWEGETPGDNSDRAASIIGPYVEAGITWWMEAMWSSPDGLNSVRKRISQGPPQAE